jgi:uncharacterized phage-associated protein
MSYMLLIKLLYLADRNALNRWGRTLTKDTYFSMKYGPVLSEVLNLISNQPDPQRPGYWDTHISDPVDYDITLRADPGEDRLSDAETEVLKGVFSDFGSYNQFQLADHLHKALPEWKEVKTGRIEITYADILAALGKSPEEVRAVEDDLAALSLVERMFSPLP